MYKCQVSGRISRPGESPQKIVVETRKKVYKDGRGNILGEGWEIVKELTVCKQVYEQIIKERLQNEAAKSI